MDRQNKEGSKHQADVGGQVDELTKSAAKQAKKIHKLAEMQQDPNAVRQAFETGEYPYRRKIKRTVYEKKKAELQVELLKVQAWVEANDQKILMLFEGRDAAGKGGTIKRLNEHMNPRSTRVVALNKPTDRKSVV